MKIFNARHLLRHVSEVILKGFMEARGYADHFQVDWSLKEGALAEALGQAVEDFNTEEDLEPDVRASRNEILANWHHELRRTFQMAHGTGTRAFLNACNNDESVLLAFKDLNDHEKALWMLTHREDAFRAAELEIAFRAKSNGKFWKKHSIPAGMTIPRSRTELESFAGEVAKLYRKEGAGEQTHVEITDRFLDGGVQITLYIEGPKTDLPQFAQDGFTRTSVRIALETAILYNQRTGEVETIVKGGVKNHKAVLELFGDMILRRQLTPEAITPERYNLNALRDGIELFEDWKSVGIQKARLRRVTFVPADDTAVTAQFGSSPDMHEPDALAIARGRLRIETTLESEYNLSSTTVMVYKRPEDKGTHFSFDCAASGSSTIKNLSEENQIIAQRLLLAWNVVREPEPPTHDDEESEPFGPEVERLAA